MDKYLNGLLTGGLGENVPMEGMIPSAFYLTPSNSNQVPIIRTGGGGGGIPIKMVDDQPIQYLTPKRYNSKKQKIVSMTVMFNNKEHSKEWLVTDDTNVTDIKVNKFAVN